VQCKPVVASYHLQPATAAAAAAAASEVILQECTVILAEFNHLAAATTGEVHQFFGRELQQLQK